MKKITHPNVVQLVEVIDAPTASSLYMVMEYVERGAVMCCVDPERGLYACPKTGESFSKAAVDKIRPCFVVGRTLITPSLRGLGVLPSRYCSVPWAQFNQNCGTSKCDT